MPFYIDNKVVLNNPTVIVPAYFFLLEDLTDSEKIMLLLFSFMKGEYSIEKVGKFKNLHRKHAKNMLQTLLKKKYIRKIKEGHKFHYYIDTYVILERAKVSSKKHLLEYMTETTNLLYNPFEMNKSEEQLIMEQITKDSKEHKTNKAKNSSKLAQQARNIYRQKIEEFIKLFEKYGYGSQILELKQKLKFKEKSFFVFCKSLLEKYSETQILQGTLSFYNKMINGQLYSTSPISLRKAWRAFIHSTTVYNSPKKTQSRNDPLLNQKLLLVEQFRRNELKNIPERYKDKIGKYVNINGIAYLPHPLTELYLYDKYPLMEV